MAVPISATNKNSARSLSQQHYGSPERWVGSGGQSSRKMSDSFFSSLFSTRRPHRKSNTIGETTIRPNYDFGKMAQGYESPNFQRKNASTASVIDESFHDTSAKISAATKPPSGKQQKYYTGTPPAYTALPSDERNTFTGNINGVKFHGPSTSSSLQHFGRRRMNGCIVENEQKKISKISTSTPSSPVAQKHSSPTQQQQRRGTFSSFIRRSLSRSRKRSPPPEQSTSPTNSELAAQKHRSISGVLAAVENVPPPQPPQQLSFAQRIKLHKGLRTGNIPIELLSQKVLLQKEQQEKRQQKAATKIKEEITKRQSKAFSTDAINEIDATSYLTETLLAIADSQPIVARSTPKHDPRLDTTYGAICACSNTEYNRNKRRVDERLRQNCIFEPEFYDQMLSDSLQVCELLQTHLNDCIDGVRARSPTALSSPFNSPPATPILTRSQSTQPYQHTNNAFGLSASLSSSPPPAPQSLRNGVLGQSPSPIRNESNEHNGILSPTQAAKYAYYKEPGDSSTIAISQQMPQKYSYYSGLGAASTPTPRVRISVSGNANRFSIRRQSSAGENTNYSSSNYSASNYSISPQMSGEANRGGMCTYSVPQLVASSLPPIPTMPHANYPHRKKFPTNVHFAA